MSDLQLVLFKSIVHSIKEVIEIEIITIAGLYDIIYILW